VHSTRANLECTRSVGVLHETTMLLLRYRYCPCISGTSYDATDAYILYEVRKRWMAVENIIARGPGGYESATSQEDNEDGYLRRYKEWYYYLYEYGPNDRYEQEKACTLHEILRTAQYLSMHESDGRELRATKRHTNNEKPIVSTMCQQLSQRVYHQAQAGRGYECADYRSTTVPVVLRATAYLRPMTNGH